MIQGHVTNSKLCLNCKECCDFGTEDLWAPFFTKEDVYQVIQKGYSAALFKRTFDPNVKQVKLIRSHIHRGHRYCPFLDTTTWLCKIYDIRPLDCELWPVIIVWDKTNKNILLGLEESCPRKFHQTRKLDNFVSKLKHTLKTKRMINFFTKHPRLVMDYYEGYTKLTKLDELTKTVRKKSQKV